MISIEDLVKQFQAYDAALLRNKSKITRFGHTEYFPFKPYEINTRTVYILQEGRTPPGLENTWECCLIASADLADWSAYRDTSMAVITVRPGISPSVLLQTIQAMLLRAYQRIERDSHLMDILLSEQGLPHLIDSVADVLGNPVMAATLHLQYLAISRSRDADAYSKEIEAERKNNCVCPEYADVLAKYKANKRRNADCTGYEPQIYTVAGKQADIAVVSVTIHGVEIAYLLSIAINHPFSFQDTELLSKAARMVSIELHKDPTFSSHKGVVNSYMMADFLKDPAANAAQMAGRLKELKFNVAAGFRIIIVSAEDLSVGTQVLETTASQIHAICASNMFVFQQDTIVYLFPASKFARSESPECKDLDRYCEENHLKVGISNEFLSLYSVANYLRQSREALRNGRFLNPNKNIYFYYDYALEDMLNNCRDQETSLENYVHPAIAALRRYDQANNLNLFETLACYLQYPSQPQKVVEILHIHKNTLYYRLNQIKEITNSDLTDGKQLFAFNCSIKVLIYLGYFSDPC